MAVAARRQQWEETASVDARRDQILRSLCSLMSEHRLASLTMHDIADKLGLVKGNLYYYFKSKQDILFHCHVKCMESSLAALQDAESTGGAAAARLRELMIRHIRSVTEGPYAGVLLADLDNLTASQRKRYVAMRDRFEKGVRHLIEDGIADGAFRSQDPRLAGFAILGAINWIPKWFRAGGQFTGLEIAERFADQMIRSLQR